MTSDEGNGSGTGTGESDRELTDIERAWCDWLARSGKSYPYPAGEYVSIQSFTAGSACGERAERARIRRELLKWFRAEDGGWRDTFTPDSIARFEDTLDRIVPEG